MSQDLQHQIPLPKTNTDKKSLLAEWKKISWYFRVLFVISLLAAVALIAMAVFWAFENNVRIIMLQLGILIAVGTTLWHLMHVVLQKTQIRGARRYAFVISLAFVVFLAVQVFPLWSVTEKLVAPFINTAISLGPLGSATISAFSSYITLAVMGLSIIAFSVSMLKDPAIQARYQEMARGEKITAAVIISIVAIGLAASILLSRSLTVGNLWAGLSLTTIIAEGGGLFLVTVFMAHLVRIGWQTTDFSPPPLDCISSANSNIYGGAFCRPSILPVENRPSATNDQTTAVQSLAHCFSESSRRQGSSAVSSDRPVASTLAAASNVSSTGPVDTRGRAHNSRFLGSSKPLQEDSQQLERGLQDLLIHLSDMDSNIAHWQSRVDFESSIDVNQLDDENYIASQKKEISQNAVLSDAEKSWRYTHLEGIVQCPAQRGLSGMTRESFQISGIAASQRYLEGYKKSWEETLDSIATTIQKLEKLDSRAEIFKKACELLKKHRPVELGESKSSAVFH